MSIVINQCQNCGVFTAKTQVQDVSLQNLRGISIAPNPASNNVMLTVNGNKKLLTVDLLNASGQELKRLTMNGETLQVNLPKLASGMYYLKISGEGFSETRKLVIQ